VPEAFPDIARRLYEQPPDGFVATRAAAVATARESGDRDTAKRLAALRKPTVAAWLVNLLAVRRPDLLDELVELAAALRAAQRDLQGEQLRELSVQRRQVVSALVAEARRLAVEVEPSTAAKLPLADVETTLTAALADTDVAEQVRSGRLVRTVSYAGFGEVPRPRLRLVTDEPDPPPARPDDAGSDGARSDDARSDGARSDDARSSGASRSGTVRVDAAEDARAAAARRAAERRETERREAERLRALRRDLTAARAAETRARADLERAEAAERDAGHAVTEIEAALAELERRRTAAHGDVSQRKLARRAAQRDTVAARRLVGDLQAALEELEGRTHR
jgi:hypothetical protein